jgi:TM2 domain-containing membrane protein YozV
MFCKQCGKPIDDGQELCEDCKAQMGSAQDANNYQAGPQQNNMNQNYDPNYNPNYNANYNAPNPQAKSKIAAGLLGIFLGSFGVHNFYLGYTGKAIAQLLITLLTCGFGAFISSIWGLIEGILILTGSINVDGNGVPLKD